MIINGKTLAFLIVIFSLLVLCVGHEDYKEELRQQADYCKNVKDGIWPDYKGTYENECK